MLRNKSEVTSINILFCFFFILVWLFFHKKEYQVLYSLKNILVAVDAFERDIAFTLLLDS